MRMWWALGLLLLAGCFEDNGTQDPSDDDVPVVPRIIMPDLDPIPVGHDHADPALHKFLWNYEARAHDPLLQNDFDTAGLHALDRVGDRLFGAVYGAHTVSINGGMVVWDISDAAAPVQLGSWYIPGDVGGDRSIEATDDGQYVVLGTETQSCAGHLNPLGALSAYLLDVSDPSNILVADVLTTAGGRGSPGEGTSSVHSVAVHHINGDDYAILFGDVYKIDRNEMGAQFVRVGFDIPTSHDHYIRDTPWGATWVLTTTAPGLSIYDISDPFNPTLVGQWEIDRFADGADSHYTHTADVAFLEDQIVIVVTAEDWNDHVSPMWIIDGEPLRNGATELALETLGWWWNPSDVHSDGLRFSLHNPRFSDDGIFTIASYHAGLWQLDLRSGWEDPQEIAYAVYADGDPTDFKDPVQEERTCSFIQLPLDAPTFFDVELGDGGVLYAADPWMGLYTFSPTADHPIYGSR